MTTRETELLAANAALEAEIVRLREATKLIVEAHDFGQFSDDFNQPQARSVRKAIRELCEALSTPFTPTALNELIEKVEKMTIERCAVVCDVEWNGDSDTYEYSIAANDLAAAIRELGEQ